MHPKSPVSIWFFVGLSLFINGVLIAASGVYQLLDPPAQRVVLYEFHAPIWWGGLMAVLGAIYTWKFWPSRVAERTQ